MIHLCSRQNEVVNVYRGSSDEGEIDCDIITQSSEEDEEEELMEEMTRGPSVESTETADDLSVRRQPPRDLSYTRKKRKENFKAEKKREKEKVEDEEKEEDEEEEEEEEEEEQQEKESPERRTDENAGKISENSTTANQADDSSVPGSDDKKIDEQVNLSKNVYLAENLQKPYSSENETFSNRLTYNFFRNLDNTPMRLRSNDLLDVPKSHRMVPQELRLRESGRGVWAREKITKGTRYGPFLGKWVSDPVDARFSWEVRVPGSNMKGFLDGTLEPNNWMKFIRSTTGKEQNVRHLLLNGQIYYETIQDVRETEELLLGQREALQLDIFGETTREEREPETASQHSGTLEDDRDDIEDEENETRCTVCNKVYPDIEQLDDHLVRTHRYPYEHFKCDRCPRAFSWRPGLLRHQTIRHGAVRKYPCENCNKIFTDPSNLQRHIRTHHVGARSHACAECGKTFATSSGLKQHTHIHSSVKPFQCEVCRKAYTQFSNLCRHRRMHADCRIQVKCNNCGQFFNSSSSQSKHRRFCESTSSPASGTTAQPLSQSSPTMNMQGTTPGNPLFIYPRPHLPFYPPSLLSPYPSLFSSNNVHPAASFMNNPVLFPTSQTPKTEEGPHKLLDNISSEYHHRAHGQRKRSYSNENERSISPTDRKRRLLNNLNQRKEIHITPPPPSALLKAKVSPSAAEEAVSLERPSPARPSVGGVTSTYPNPRELLSPENKDIKTKEETTKLGDSSAINTENSKEQPLDLRVTKKKITYTEESTNVEKSSSMASAPDAKKPKLSTKKSPSPIPKESQSNEFSEPKSKLNLHQSASENISSTLTSTNSSPTPPAMVYPRPIHPMLLEAMYRPTGFPQSFPPQNDRLLGPHPPPPPPPFGHSRTFPFLGSLVNGLPNGQSNQRSFDILRNPLPGFTGVKPYQDVLTSHIGNGIPAKMKDRYTCKYCFKIFPRSANLTRHVRTHTGEQPYKCQYCERSFSISSNLQRHVRNIHNKEKPFKCPSCERCFGQQTNLDRHLKKHEADDESGNTPVADSPESNENEREDACFDEIRMFMGKVTYSAESAHQIYPSRTSPRLTQDAGSVKKEEDSENLSEEDSSTTNYTEERIMSPKDYPLALTYDAKLKVKQEAMNNNTPDQEPIEVAT